ncbi:MAG: hypothetical protein IKZ19_07525 [Clostridia bacterium]|nr:hypothetical protein [Clostridia bacterium]
MYGYIRPLKPELRIREFELYNAAYCGLCRQLGKDYGLIARFAVSYDCAMPALMASVQAGEICRHRCPANIFRKKPCLCGGDGMKLTAAATMILLRHKLKDSVADGGFFKKSAAKALLLLGRGKFRKAESLWPEFAAEAVVQLAFLSAMETDPPKDESVLDRTADCFARVTAAFSLMRPDGSERRLWHEIYYHVGRVVYILDAADDWARDIKDKNFNPAVLRYGLSAPQGTDLLPAETREKISLTLESSLAAAAAAFELLPGDAASPIVGNIIYLGIPSVISQVLNRTKDKKRKKKG